MKKLSFLCAAFFVFFIIACANSTGDNSQPSPQPVIDTGARLNFINGNFVAWYVDEQGHFLINEDFYDDEKPFTFRWFRKNPETASEEEIINSNKSYYIYDESQDLNQIIVVKITYDGITSQAESEKILGTIDEAYLDFEQNFVYGDLLQAENIGAYCLCSDDEYYDSDEVNVSIALVRQPSEENEDIYYADEIPEMILWSSNNYAFLVRVPGYSAFICEQYITTQLLFDDSEVPALSADVQNIKLGCIRFEDTDFALEYMIDDEWKAFENGDEIAVPGDITQIKIRKAAQGVAGGADYLKESEEKIVTVRTENIGKNMEEISPVIVPVYDYVNISKEDLSVLITRSGNSVLFQAAVNGQTFADDDSVVYEWFIDNKESSLYSGTGVSGNKLSVDSSSNIPKGCPVNVEIFVRSKTSAGRLYYANLIITF